MEYMQIVVGIRPRKDNHGFRKKYVAVSPDKTAARMIAIYMQQKEKRNYRYFVDEIDCYDNFYDFIADNGFEEMEY